MVLSDLEIRAALEDGRLVIDPAPEERHYDPTAVDLRLSGEFVCWGLDELKEALGEVPPIRIGEFRFTELARQFLRPVPKETDDCVILRPGGFFLTTTLETVGFDSTLAGRVEGKSSLARLGLSVHFAPTLHATWKGQITLELHNAGPVAIKLTEGDRVCQLLVEPVQGELVADMEGTQFQDQTSPGGHLNS